MESLRDLLSIKPGKGAWIYSRPCYVHGHANAMFVIEGIEEPSFGEHHHKRQQH